MPQKALFRSDSDCFVDVSVGGRELLERIISDDYMLTEKECVHFMRQICEGVSYIHTRFVLHLDIKPENILCVTPNSNEIKIIDFGLARKFDPKKSARVGRYVFLC